MSQQRGWNMSVSPPALTDGRKKFQGSHLVAKTATADVVVVVDIVIVVAL